MPYDVGHNPSDPNATPDNGHLLGIFGGWTCDDWVTFHKALDSSLGRDAANTKWLSFWNDQDFWSTDYSWCKYGNNFANYFKSVGLADSTGNIISQVVVGAENVGKNLIDTVTNASSVLKWAVPAFLVVILGTLVVLVSSSSKSSSSPAPQPAPGNGNGRGTNPRHSGTGKFVKA